MTAEMPAIPGAAPAAGRIAATGAALLAAVAIPGNPPGLGLALVAWAIAAAVVLCRPRQREPEAVVLAVLALPLASMAALRDAGWVVALDLLAAGCLGSAAVARAEGWELLAAPVRAVGRMGAGLSALRPPGGTRQRLDRLAPALRGVVVGAGLLVVFGTLFASADAAFAQLAGRLTPDVDLALVPLRLLTAMVVLAFVGGLIGLGPRFAAERSGDGDGAEPRGRRLGRTEWITALSMLDVLFLAFVLVQLAVLFGGRDYVLETVGMTYAEYARQGFFQLLAVAALVLGVIAASARWSARASRRDEILLRLLLGVLSLLTLVVLWSALRRLNLYEATFGYTPLRISVHATILWLGAIFVLVGIAGTMRRASWLPRAAVTITAVGLLGFSLWNPDGVVASNNVRRFEETGLIDLAHLTELSADAVPALAGLPADLRACAYAVHAARMEPEDPILGWNLSRSRARDVLPADAPAPVDACAGLEAL